MEHIKHSKRIIREHTTRTSPHKPPSPPPPTHRQLQGPPPVQHTLTPTHTHKTQNTKHKTQNTKRKAQNTKHKTQNIEHRTQNTKHKHSTQNTKHSTKHKTQNTYTLNTYILTLHSATNTTSLQPRSYTARFTWRSTQRSLQYQMCGTSRARHHWRGKKVTCRLCCFLFPAKTRTCIETG